VADTAHFLPNDHHTIVSREKRAKCTSWRSSGKKTGHWRDSLSVAVGLRHPVYLTNVRLKIIWRKIGPRVGQKSSRGGPVREQASMGHG
jgi:hypothetical protein